MKNIVSSVLVVLICLSSVNAQKVFTDRKEYEKALQNYNDALDSYNNFQKKVKFYSDYKFSKSESYPTNGDAWYNILKPGLDKLGIKMDNKESRLHPNVESVGTVYFSFIEVPSSKELKVKITDYPLNPYDYKFSAHTCKFNHPGKPPILKEKKAIAVIEEIKKDSVKVVEPKMVYVPPVKYVEPVKYNLYMMPDGKRYTYSQLVVMYPSLKSEIALRSNFK